MNPQQYGGYPPTPPNNPYDFITSAQQKPPRAPGTVGGNSFIGRLLLIVGGAVVFMVVGAVVVNLLFSSKTNVGSLIAITQTQQEIIRVAGQGSDQGVSDQVIAGSGMNARLVLTTQQQNMLTYMGTQGKNVNKKELDLKKDTKTDTQFAQAKATSTFDIVYAQVLTQELKDYAASLKTAYNNASSTEMKTLLAKDYNETQLLLKQWPND
ncbi:MAG TPA: hypothetical protein VLF62_01035 [Candidatus Saccharimonadales bacterium]|nr:hypothetical protein [Candidatus Saccharimonadales bacterium]